MEVAPVADLMIQKNGTTAEWAADDDVLEVAQLGVDTDTGEVKIGDGVTAWSALDSLGGAGGGGGGGVLLIDYGDTVPGGTATGTVIFEKGPPATTWDLRSLSAMPAGWSRRGVASETFDADGMTATHTAGQGHQYTPSPYVPDFSVTAKVINGSGSGVMQGPMISDSSGNGAMACWYSGSGGLIAAKMTGWTYGSATSVETNTVYHPVWLRLRVTGTDYYAAHSNDGATWHETPVLSFSGGGSSTIGIGSIISSAAMETEQIIYSPGAGGGGLRGWWDDTAGDIILF